MLDPCITLCQVPGFQNRQDLWAHQIYYKIYLFHLYQATLYSKRNHFMANVHYIIKIKDTNTEEILYLKGMQIGVILSGLGMAASFSHWQIYLPPYIWAPQSPSENLHHTDTTVQIISATYPSFQVLWISLYRTPYVS